MIPRLRLATYRAAHGVSWPEPGTEPVHLLSPRPAFRKLRVLVDVDTVDVNSGEFCLGWLLTGLLQHAYIDAYRYSEAGPPASVPRRTIGHTEVVPGWVVRGSVHPDSVLYSANKTVTHAAIRGNAADVAENDTQATAYSSLGPVEASKRRRADMIAALVAGAVHADILVTERPYLNQLAWAPADGVTFCRPQDALAIVGLYLRSQNQYVFLPDLTCNKGLFYWVGARELLPNAWGWFSALVQHDGTSIDGELTNLGGSVLSRVSRALEVRDEVHRALNVPQNNDTADDALAALDNVCLLLMGALDAAALVAHKVLTLKGSAYAVGWQKKDWRRELIKAVPDFRPIVEVGTDGERVLTVLALLRNTIHGAALQPIAVGNQLGQRDSTLIGLPAAQTTRLLAAIDGLGGQPVWGVQQLLPDRFHAEPGLLLEQLFPRAVELLNALLAATPVERLDGAKLGTRSGLPPAEPDSPFSPEKRRSIRWQLGL
jgi:hypothetical protein